MKYLLSLAMASTSTGAGSSSCSSCGTRGIEAQIVICLSISICTSKSLPQTHQGSLMKSWCAHYRNQVRRNGGLALTHACASCSISIPKVSSLRRNVRHQIRNFSDCKTIFTVLQRQSLAQKAKLLDIFSGWRYCGGIDRAGE